MANIASVQNAVRETEAYQVLHAKLERESRNISSTKAILARLTHDPAALDDPSFKVQVQQHIESLSDGLSRSSGVIHALLEAAYLNTGSKLKITPPLGDVDLVGNQRFLINTERYIPLVLNVAQPKPKDMNTKLGMKETDLLMDEILSGVILKAFANDELQEAPFIIMDRSFRGIKVLFDLQSSVLKGSTKEEKYADFLEKIRQIERILNPQIAAVIAERLRNLAIIRVSRKLSEEEENKFKTFAELYFQYGGSVESMRGVLDDISPTDFGMDEEEIAIACLNVGLTPFRARNKGSVSLKEFSFAFVLAEQISNMVRRRRMEDRKDNEERRHAVLMDYNEFIAYLSYDYLSANRALRRMANPATGQLDPHSPMVRVIREVNYVPPYGNPLKQQSYLSLTGAAVYSYRKGGVKGLMKDFDLSHEEAECVRNYYEVVNTCDVLKPWLEDGLDLYHAKAAERIWLIAQANKLNLKPENREHVHATIERLARVSEMSEKDQGFEIDKGISQTRQAVLHNLGDQLNENGRSVVVSGDHVEFGNQNFFAAVEAMHATYLHIMRPIGPPLLNFHAEVDRKDFIERSHGLVDHSMIFHDEVLWKFTMSANDVGTRYLRDYEENIQKKAYEVFGEGTRVCIDSSGGDEIMFSLFIPNVQSIEQEQLDQFLSYFGSEQQKLRILAQTVPEGLGLAELNEWICDFTFRAELIHDHIKAARSKWHANIAAGVNPRTVMTPSELGLAANGYVHFSEELIPA